MFPNHATLAWYSANAMRFSSLILRTILYYLTNQATATPQNNQSLKNSDSIIREPLQHVEQGKKQLEVQPKKRKNMADHKIGTTVKPLCSRCNCFKINTNISTATLKETKTLSQQGRILIFVSNVPILKCGRKAHLRKY